MQRLFHEARQFYFVEKVTITPKNCNVQIWHNFDFLYVHQVITSLARTGILFQNNLKTFKLLIIMLISTFDIYFYIYISIYR